MHRSAAIFALACLAPAAARATVPDLYGTGARSMGAGGGGVAVVDDGTAARLNPAGLARIRQPTAAFGLSAAWHGFQRYPALYWDTNRDGVVDDRDEPLAYPSTVDDAIGAHVSAGRQVGGKFGIGLVAYVPSERLIRFRTFDPELPTYFMYENRPQRYVAAAGVGGEIFKGVAIGAAIDVLASARVDVWMTADARITGDGEDAEGAVSEVTLDVHEIELDLVPVLAPIVGVRLEPGRWLPVLDGLVIGASWRKGAGLPIDVHLDVQANGSVEDFGDLDPYIAAILLDAKLDLFDHYAPPVANLGLAWKRPQGLSGWVDARFTGWHAMTVNVARVREVDVTSPLVEIDEAFADGNAYEAVLGDTWSFNGGAELRLPKKEVEKRWKYVQVTVRAGGGFVPSPLKNQGTTSALLDADRTLLTAGAGVEIWDPFSLVDAPVRFDAFGQAHLLARGLLPREASAPTAGYPVEGGGIPIGGQVIVVGGQLGFDY